MNYPVKAIPHPTTPISCWGPSVRILAFTTAILIFLAVMVLPAWATLEIEPENCGSYSVLPQLFQYWQEQTGWMGIAVGPENPNNSVYLRTLPDPWGAPLHISEYDNETNFLVKDWTGGPEWGYVEAYTNGPFNYTFLIDWEPGEGNFPLGGEVQVNYAGFGWDCGLLRVWDLGLTAGHDYRFWLNTTVPGDDVRVALLRTGGQDGWLSRADAYVEWQAAPFGQDDPHDYAITETGTYALVVFNNSILTPGGTYSLRVEDLNPPPAPDLVIDHIEPETAPAGQPFEVIVHVRNQGGVYAEPSYTELRVEGVFIDAVYTPGINPGDTAEVLFQLGSYGAGMLDVEAEADCTQAVDEPGNEDNNEATAQIELLGEGYPDLVINHIEPTSIIQGEDLEITIYVRNQGSVAAGPSLTHVQVLYYPVEIELQTPAIPSGQMVAVQWDVVDDWEESIIVAALANYLGHVNEGGNDTNNYAEELIDIIPPAMPDLIVGSIAPDVATGGEDINVTIYVENIGTATSDACEAVIWINNDEVVDIVTIPPAQPGETVATSSLNIGTYWQGTLEVYTHINFDGGTPESEYANNEAIEYIDVLIPEIVAVHADGLGDFPTIQAAVDALPDSVRIQLAPGVYTGEGNRDINFQGKELRVECTEANIGQVIIDCEGTAEDPHRAFYFNTEEQEGAELYGLTIINGHMPAGEGGAIYIRNANPTISYCTIMDCLAEFGGGMYIESPTSAFGPSIDHCTIVNCDAALGSALSLEGGVGTHITNSILAYNKSALGGGPVYCNGSPWLTMSCSDVYGNLGGDYIGCLAGFYGNDGNFSDDPLFCDLAGGDLTIHVDSPCTIYQNPGCGWVGAHQDGCGAAGQHVYLVKPDGTGDYPNIRAAITACGNGDIIELADGTFTGSDNKNLTLMGKEITIRSQSGDPGSCTIDLQGSGLAFGFDNVEGPQTVIENLTIANGDALSPGAMYFINGSPTVNNVIMQNCHTSGAGGAVRIVLFTSPIFNDCQFLGNQSDGDGGAVHCESGATPVFNHCLFEGNVAADAGGAAYVWQATPEFNDCRFIANQSTNQGGAVVLLEVTDGILQNCFFEVNVGSAGGAFYANASTAELSGSTFVSNEAEWGGAGYATASADLDILSCTFYQNEVTDGGNAMSIVGSFVDITHTIIVQNTGPNAALYCTGGANVQMGCSDVWGNEGGDYVDCLVGQNGVNGNISVNPQFCLDTGPTDLTLHVDSACTPDNSSCGLMGAWPEACGPRTFIVDAAGTGDHPTIQAAIDASSSGSTVLLENGVYTGVGNRDLTYDGKDITVRSADGDPALCIIDCGGSDSDPHRGFVFNSGEGYQSVLEGVTVRNAWQSGAAGAVYAVGTGPTIRNCWFENNHASDGAGLFATSGSSVYLEDCRFTGNQATNGGGGVRASASSSVSLVRCDFLDNYAHWGGGGLYTYYSTAIVEDCVFARNGSNAWGGGLHSQEMGANPVSVSGSTFWGNHAPEGGAVYCRDNGAVVIESSILSFSTYGGAAFCDDNGTIDLACSDVFGNTDGNWSGCIAGQAGINNNFSQDPLFCDPASDQFTLLVDSPCAAGNNPACGQVGARGTGCGLTHLVQANGGGDYPTIQAAIDAASPYDVILLADGTFTGDGNRDLDYGGRPLHIKSQSGDPTSCVIDCQGSSGDEHRGFYFHSGEGTDCLLQGVSVINGYIVSGGAVLCEDASPVLRQCHFDYNYAFLGGAIRCEQGASPHIEDCNFYGNSAQAAFGSGGAISVYLDSEPVITDCDFASNHAAYGGAVHGYHQCGVAIYRSVFEGNQSAYSGGAVTLSEGAVGFLEDCTFLGNQASWTGGGAFASYAGGGGTIRGSTFYDNLADGGGAGAAIYVNDGGNLAVENCLLAFNQAGGAVHCGSNASITVSCTDIYGNAGGDWTGCIADQLLVPGNISEDPLFCDPSAGIMNVADSSPCLPWFNECQVQMGAWGAGCEAVTDVETELPVAFSLSQNYPNPFNPSTRIHFALPEASKVSLKIYDIAGRRVRDLVAGEAFSAGHHEVVWTGRDEYGRGVASGIYFYHLEAGSHRETKKMMMLK